MAGEKKSAKEMIDQFKKEHPAKQVQGAAVHGDVPVAKTEEPATPVEQQEERVIPPKEFFYLPSNGVDGIDAVIVIMSMPDIVDYTQYAKYCYAVGEDGDRDNVSPRDAWQRKLDPKRAANEIKPYLGQELHFLPPLIGVVTSGEAFKLDETNGKITLTEKSVAVLDGQHRRAGIEFYLAEAGLDSDFANEEVPVMIITSDLSVEDRQQIFSDINRNPKTVAKTLNIMFDHRDVYAVIAQRVAQTFDGHIELSKNTPGQSTSDICTVGNVYMLAYGFGAFNPKKKHSPLREGLTAEVVQKVCETVILSLPSADRMLSGTDTYKGVRAAFPCYSSTFFQAIGLSLGRHLAGCPVDQLLDRTEKLIKGTQWTISNPDWRKPGFEVVHADGKIGTRRDDIDNCAAVLSTMWGASEFQKPEETEKAA